MPKILTNCPTCHKSNTWTSENKFKPFCSERCKLIDFGDWIDEKNCVAGDPVNEDQQPSDDEDN